MVLSHVWGLTSPGGLWSVQLTVELEGPGRALGKGRWMWTEGTQEVRLPLRGKAETAVGSYCTWRGRCGGRSQSPTGADRAEPGRARESGAEGMKRKQPLQAAVASRPGGESARRPPRL